MNIFGFFRFLGSLLNKGLTEAKKRGLTDEVIQRALTLVREAAHTYANNEVRRAQVLAVLMRQGIPESIARLAIELALNALKAETTVP